MSNLFISHSSVDKPFVRKLATSLLAEGFPIWLDSWSLELGDSLSDKIYNGIETSGAVLLTMSESSAASGWVTKELKAALRKEKQIGRTFIIPIKIDGYHLPPELLNRLYADFSSSFSAPLSTLVESLSKVGLRDITVSSSRELLPLSFTQETHLDTATLKTALQHIKRRQGCVNLSFDQIVINDDPEYQELFRRLHKRIDSIAVDPFFSPQLEEYLRSALSYVQEREKYLKQGVALMVSKMSSLASLYWFCHRLRAQTVGTLWGCQAPKAADNLTYGAKLVCATFGDNQSAATYFGTKEVLSAVIWSHPKDIYGSQYLTFWIPSTELKDLLGPEGKYRGPVPALDALNYPAFARYVYPQVVLQAITENLSVPWSLEDAWIGVN